LRGIICCWYSLFVASLPAQFVFSGQAPEDYYGQIVYLDILDEWDHFQLISDQMTVQSARIDSTGFYSLSGFGLPPDLGFYRLRFALNDTPVVSMNFDRRHYIHFAANAKDTLQFNALSIQQPTGDNRLIDEVATALDKLAAEARHAETDRLLSLIDERRANLLNARLEDGGAIAQTYLVGNWPREGPPLDVLRKVEHTLTEAPLLRPSYLSSLRSRIGALDVDGLQSNNRLLRWLLTISLILHLSVAIWWYLRKTATPPSPQPELTTKEIQVLDLITSGKSNKEIATALFISTATVKTHVNSIYKKAGLKNRAAAVAFGEKRNSTRV